jgi:hypothetical protein
MESWRACTRGLGASPELKTIKKKKKKKKPVEF